MAEETTGSFDTPEEELPPGHVMCDVTGQVVLEEETIVIEGYRVCAEGKAQLLERLKAGDGVFRGLEVPNIALRIVALIIDVIIVWIAYLPLLILFGLGTLTSIGAWGAPTGAAAGMVALISFTYIFLWLAYYTLLHGLWGQTVGKMAVGLKVIKQNETKMDLQTAFIRALVLEGPSILLSMIVVVGVSIDNFALQQVSSLAWLYYLATFIVALVAAQQRSIHDMVAKTRVVTAQSCAHLAL